jgi:methionyl aminopeptidase
MAIIIKNEEQIDGIRKSCELAADTLRFLKYSVRDGMSTQKLNEIAEEFIRDHGAIPAPLNYMGFPKAICTSLNEVICHGIPSDEIILKDGDIINIDVTTILNGYYGDTSTMFPVGSVSDEARKLMTVTQDCLSIGICQVKPDNEFYKIGSSITEYATRRGYSVVYQFCGHGTGIDFHEEPQINHAFNARVPKDNRKMKPGMIFTIEPMINQGLSEAVIDVNDKWTARTKDGRLSAQYEHTVLVTHSGVEVLTK